MSTSTGTDKIGTLLYSPTSPFVRKIITASRELGILHRLTITRLPIGPLLTDAEIWSHNPLGKVPSLIIEKDDDEDDDDEVLFPSPVVLRYLDIEGRMTVAGGDGNGGTKEERLKELQLEALCDGILDAMVLVHYELTIRPESTPSQTPWQSWIDGQTSKARRGLRLLASRVRHGTITTPKPDQVMNVVQISLAAVLWWLQRRFPEQGWLEDEEMAVLKGWEEVVKKRESMAPEPEMEFGESVVVEKGPNGEEKIVQV